MGIYEHPICISVPIDFETSYKHSDLRVNVSETVETENYYDDAGIGQSVEACCATWFRKDDDKQHYVKCLEVAEYYVKIDRVGGGGVYCGFHRPTVRSL